MLRAKLIHNPNAGEGKFTGEELVNILKDKGYIISYANAKKTSWDYWDEDDDIIIVAGGDGTVRKLVKKLVRRKLIDKRFPIAVLPLGTANNIASTFYADKEVHTAIKQWEKQHTRSIDIARIRGIEEENFFMEGLGVGVFPQLMKKMKEQEEREDETPQEELRTAQSLFADIVSTYKPRFCQLIIDGEDYSGHYVLIEVMNMQAVGPNLHLAPNADPSDGLFDIVLVTAAEQQGLAAYATQKAAGEDVTYQFQCLQGKDIRLQWSGAQLHVDDQLVKTDKNTPIHIQLEPGLLVFYVDASQVNR
jgi:diacylglycerol kinase (ATP)